MTHVTYKRFLGRRIEEIRESLGMTQQEFAEALGAPQGQPQVSRWERGEVRPQQKTLRTIAELVGEGVEIFAPPKDLLSSLEPDASYSASPDGSPAEQLIYYFSEPAALRRFAREIGAKDLIKMAYTIAIDDGWPEGEIRKLDAWRRDLLGPDEAIED